MERLILMNAPSQDTDRQAVIVFLKSVVAADPNVTWPELVTALQEYREDVGLDGWLTNTLKAVGGALDGFTFGGASKFLLGTKQLVADAFPKKKVADSLKDAAAGIGDDMLSNFLDALPFGIGSDLKTGNVVNRFWLIGLLVIGLVVAFFFFRRK